MTRHVRRTLLTITAVALAAVALILTGCSGGGGLSSQVVSGTASVGTPLAGQVTLKDSSTSPQTKTTVIGSNGSYAIDVTGLTAPYILQATGSAGGTAYTLHSFAEGPGTANINPLTDAIVASAAGDDDASQTYDTADSEKLHTIGTRLQNTVTTILTKLQPLLQQYGAENTNPITSSYIVNHLGLDGMFDSVRITVANGILTITNAKTGAVIYSGKLSDIAAGNFYPGTLPPVAAAPAAPTGVTAVGGSGQVTVSWAPVSNATSYNIYWSTTSGVTTTTGTKIAGATSPYVQNALNAGTTYYYVVTAVNASGESPASTEVSAATAATAPTPTAPAAPTGVMATGGTNQVTISWSPVSGATSYNIYWSTTSGVTTANGTKIAGATTPAVQTGLTAGTTYYYVVTAVNGAGESPASVQVAATTMAAAPAPTAPAAPTGVTATGGTNQVTVSWPTVTGATSYNIYWSTTSGVTTNTGTKIAGATSPYVQTGLAAGTTYYYVVTAVNSVGESAASSPASTTTSAPLPTVPAAPTGVTVTGGTSQETISWSPVSGATSYNIYWSTTSGVTTTTGTKIANAVSPYVQTGLAASTTYYYVVTAVNSAGESPASAQASAATSAPAFDALTFYKTVCLGCHGTLGPRTAAQITAAIANVGAMQSLSYLTADQIAAIAAVSY